MSARGESGGRREQRQLGEPREAQDGGGSGQAGRPALQRHARVFCPLMVMAQDPQMPSLRTGEAPTR